MPLKFVTLSLEDEKETKNVIKKFRKKYDDHIRYLVYEMGSEQNHYHAHAIVEMPSGDASHTSRVAKKCQIPSDQVYGIRMDTIKDHKMELYYAGYMQKEFFTRDTRFGGDQNHRTFKCIYGKKYLDKAWEHFKKNQGIHKRTVKDSYDGTLLARKVLETSTIIFKEHDDFLEALLDYANERDIDVKNPDKMVGIMMSLWRMEKRKNKRQKKI